MLRRFLQISIRNVFRHKRRTALTLLILIFGATGLILVGGFFSNLGIGYREQFIHSQTGHLQINLRDYSKKGASAPFDYLITDVSQLQNLVESRPHVTYSVPRLKFGGMLSNENTSVAVLAVGTDPLLERRMSSLRAVNTEHSSSRILAGQDLDPKDPQGILLGKGLAENLGIHVGDSIDFLTTRQAGSIEGSEFHLRGIFETIAKDFDDRAMKLNLTTAQELLGVQDQVHSLLAVLDDTNLTEEVKEDLERALQSAGHPFEILTWKEQGVFYRQGKEMLDQIFLTVQIILCVIFFFSIANAINMALLERMREFGTMMAIGNSRWIISSMIILEALVLGILGATLGIGFGSLLAQVITAVGIKMPPIPMGSSEYFAMISLTPSLLAKTFLLVLGSTFLSSLIPAYRAAHFNIIRALGYV